MIQQFNMDNIRLLQELGYEVDVACNMKQGSTITDEKVSLMKSELETMGVHVYHIPVPRSITNIKDIWKSFWITRKLINEQEYSLIHCHSPIGGMICRLANRLSKWYGQVRMIYTAHGFHFYKGAPKINWLLFYPIERICSCYSDVLITINQEDYALAKRKMKSKLCVYVPGVGVDLQKFKKVSLTEKSKFRILGVSDKDTVLVSVGELSTRKNHEVVIRALSKLNNPNYKYFICGLGPLEHRLEKLILDLKMQSNIRLLGYRSDIAEILNMADVYVFPSLQEGLPVALMESMAAGKAVACSRIRGNTDLVDSNGGVLFDPHSVDDCTMAIDQLLHSNLAKMGEYNSNKIRGFSKETVRELMSKIYSK
ncbi:glycosyltransferase [Hominenteromicrobium sp.]